MESKYKERAKKLLKESITDSNGDICRNYNEHDIIEVMCQLAEEVEKELNNKILFLDIMCKAKDKTIRDYYRKTNLYTKEQVEELLQKQRELCSKEAKIEKFNIFDQSYINKELFTEGESK